MVSSTVSMLTGNILQSINWSTNQFYGDAGMSLSCEDLGDIVVEKLPPVDHNGEIGESISKSSIRLRMPFRPEYIGRRLWVWPIHQCTYVCMRLWAGT
jgi:hypothetical protein